MLYFVVIDLIYEFTSFEREGSPIQYEALLKLNREMLVVHRLNHFNIQDVVVRDSDVRKN